MPHTIDENGLVHYHIPEPVLHDLHSFWWWKRARAQRLIVEEIQAFWNEVYDPEHPQDSNS